jgi:vacuolar iron transporter family protein
MDSDAPSREYTAEDIKRFRSYLKEEVDGKRLYELLADAEDDPHLQELYVRLAESENRHIELWRSKIEEAGGSIPNYSPSWQVRGLGFIARRFGTESVTPIVTRMEVSATNMYDGEPHAEAHNLPADERSHARLFQEIGRKGNNVGLGSGVDIARIEGRHRGASGNTLRALVLGANDGLVSNLSLVMGVAGADPGRDVVLLTGVAGLVAGAMSMALGEWISVRSSAESFQRQVQIEKEELEFMPEEEEEELALIYQAKGLSEEDARATAQRIIKSPETALDTLVREELGMAEAEVGSAWTAAVVSFLMFAVGAALPVLPWLAIGGGAAVVLSVVLSAAGLALLGAAITLWTGRGALFSSARMLAFGLTAAAITFAIGTMIGAAAGI